MKLSANFWDFVVALAIGAIGTARLNAMFPGPWWFVVGIAMPLVFAALCAGISTAHGRWDDGRGFTIGSIGAATGSFLAFYVVPFLSQNNVL